jgi:hypothetical protein
MSRFVLLTSSVLTAAAVVLFTLGVAIGYNAVLADEPLAQGCVGCSCYNGEGEVCDANAYPHPACEYETYTCTCEDVFDNYCEPF